MELNIIIMLFKVKNRLLKLMRRLLKDQRNKVKVLTFILTG